MIAMTSITIDLSDSQFQKLEDLAKAHQIPLEILLKSSFENWLNSQTTEFINAADYVLNKNAELYKRLA
ncbi:MAG: DNA-binding protein [Dolichospermum sp.]